MTQAQRARVMYDNGFVDIVLEDGSVLSLKIDERIPALDRYDCVADHCAAMGDEGLAETYLLRRELQP